MFNIFRNNCCGIDVHKTWIYACIGITDANGRTEYQQARFSSFSKGLRELSDWLAKFSCVEVCTESAGKYWIPVFNILEKSCFVTLAHPKYTKPQKGNKTDRKDAKWICDLFMCDMIKPSFIPPPDIRHLRDLMRYRFKLTNCMTGEKNRALNCLTVSNLKLDDVFSDVFGKSARSITEHMLKHPGESFDVAPFLDRRCKHSAEKVQLRAINAKIVPEAIINYRKPAWLEGRTVIAVDASDVSEKGRSGRIYRLHYALDLFQMSSVQHMIIRLRRNSFTVRDAQGQKIELTEKLENLNDDEYLDLPAYATNLQKDSIPIRICAKRKTREAIEQSQKKLRRNESKKQFEVSDETRSFHNYIVLATSLDESISVAEVLDTYRLRWQVEIFFKRLKSIMDFGELPKRREKSVLAWLNGKIMIALLIEKMIASMTFPPAEYAEQEYMA